MANITSKEKCIVIDKVSIPLNSMVCTELSDGARLTFVGTSSFIDIKVSGTTIDGVHVTNKAELITYLQDNCFSLGGGSGEGAVNSVNGKSGDVNLTPSDIGAADIEDIELAIDNATIFFDSETFKGKNFPSPGSSDPKVGTITNPITGISVDVVENGNMNAVTSNAVFDAIKIVIDMITSGNINPPAPTNPVTDDVNKLYGFTL